MIVLKQQTLLNAITTYICFEGTLIICRVRKVSPFLRGFEPVEVRVEVCRLTYAISEGVGACELVMAFNGFLVLHRFSSI